MSRAEVVETNKVVYSVLVTADDDYPEGRVVTETKDDATRVATIMLIDQLREARDYINELVNSYVADAQRYMPEHRPDHSEVISKLLRNRELIELYSKDLDRALRRDQVHLMSTIYGYFQENLDIEDEFKSTVLIEEKTIVTANLQSWLPGHPKYVYAEQYWGEKGRL